jgi:hypothetical protein
MNLDDPGKARIVGSPIRRRVVCGREDAPVSTVVATLRLEEKTSCDNGATY